MLTRIHDPERGASFIEYAGVTVVITAIIASVLSVGIPQSMGETIAGGIEAAYTGEHFSGADDSTGDASDPDSQPTDSSESGDDQSDQGTDSGESKPGSGESGLSSLGLDDVMPAASPPGGGELLEGAGDLVDSAAGIQSRIQDRVGERAQESVDGAVQLVTDPPSVLQDAHEGMRADFDDNVHNSLERWGPEYAAGNELTAYAGAAMDSAFYAYLDTPMSMSVPAIIGNKGQREQISQGQGVEAAVDAGIDLGLGALPGPKTTIPKPSRSPDAPEPDPDAQHLAGDERPNSNDPDNRNNEDQDDDNDPNGGTPCSGGNSFVAGTPVLVADGSTVPIEDIDVGDDVLAFDPTTGEEGPREVTETITGDGHKTLVDITLTDTDGATSTLTATDEHPFWAPKAEQWVEATDLRAGTWLRTSAGTWAQTTATNTRTVDDQQVHNLTIDGLHTYYVESGSTNTLVHNDGPCSTSSPWSFERTHEIQGNRSSKNVRRLTEDMRENGWQGSPIAIVEHDGKRFIVDGHHRVAAAKRANIDVPYEPVDLPYQGYNDLDDMLESWSTTGFDRIR